jgi:hypothetical protein
MNLLTKTSEDFTKNLNQIILIEAIDIKANNRLRQIFQFAGDIKPEALVARWNAQSPHKFGLIGTMKEGDKITLESKEYTFQGIGQLSASKNESNDSTLSHLKFIDSDSNAHLVNIKNKYLTSAFISNFVLNKKGKSITSLQENSKKNDNTPISILLSKCEKETVFALHALLEEKEYPVDKVPTVKNLIEKRINVFNLHNLAVSIDVSNLSITDAFTLSGNSNRVKIKNNDKTTKPSI